MFNSLAELWPGASEKIEPGAFANSLSNDIRALTDHDTRLVLGRNKVGTLELQTDARGLWGRIHINPGDSEAMNLYERVKRGDVSNCSFGFNIIKEEIENRDDGSVLFILEEIDLHEVSVVTFPAYEDTSVQARKADLEKIQREKFAAKKKAAKERINKIWR